MKRRCLETQSICDVPYSQIGLVFPFVNRDVECSMLVKILFKCLYKNIPRSSTNFDSIKNDLGFPVALGLSGIGKSRFGCVGISQFAAKHVESSDVGEDPVFDAFVELISSSERCLNLRLGLETVYNLTNVEEMIARKILFEWLKSFKVDGDMHQLEFECKHISGAVTIAQVLDIIFEQDQYECIYVNIDEADKGSDYLVMLLSIFGEYFARGKCLLFFVSGIKTSTLVSKIGASSMRPQFIHLPPLRIDHMTAIVNYILPSFQSENVLFLHLMWLTGGIPRHLAQVLASVAAIRGIDVRDRFNNHLMLDYLQMNTTQLISVINHFKSCYSFIPGVFIPSAVFHDLVALSISDITLDLDMHLLLADP